MTDEQYRRYSASEIREEMTNLKNWKLVDGKLHRELEFRTFDDAISFMMRSALEITKLDHHPEWYNVYTRVKIDLVTHDLGGISGYDFILAKKLDQLAKIFKAK